MRYYSYKVEHDLGLAPNPFGGYCTLSVCKPMIRKSNQLSIGDWIIGTGSKALSVKHGVKMEGRVIYAMQVGEIMPMENYWSDPRFRVKKPVVNGSLERMYGDNFYYKDNSNEWNQIDSAHSNADGTPNETHLKKDTDGKNTLISDHYYYFGNNAPKLPDTLSSIPIEGIGQKLLEEQLGRDLVQWLTSGFTRGINGRPISWAMYDQQKLF